MIANGEGGQNRETVDGAVAVMRSLRPALSDLDVGRCSAPELQNLARAAREGQVALDGLLARVGMAADRLTDRQAPGARDAGETLLDQGQVRGSTARRDRARSDVAGSLDKVGAAVERGLLGGDQLDSFARAAKSLTEEQRQELNSDHLVDAAVSLPADTFEQKIRRHVDRIRNDHGLNDARAKREASTWRHWYDENAGMGRISAAFDPERYEAITNAVEQHLARLANKGQVTKSDNLAAAAAHELLTGNGSSGSGRPHINVVVDHKTLATGPHGESVRETAQGHSLPPETINRLACDAVLQRVTLDELGVPLDVGRRHRTATDGQWQAVRSIYRSCAWAGCERPLSWCQLHHIHEWEHGGRTDLCNLIPLCLRHHHQVHEGGWSVKLRTGRSLEIFRPDGGYLATTTPDRVRRDPARPQAP